MNVVTKCKPSLVLSDSSNSEYVGSQCAGKTGGMQRMKKPYGEGPANHTGPESCAVVRKGRGEALTGVRAGRVLSRENHKVRAADVIGSGGRQYPVCRHRKAHRKPARSETPIMHGTISLGSREIPCPPAAEGVAGRAGKSKDAHRQ